jgi:hypothetical protein
MMVPAAVALLSGGIVFAGVVIALRLLAIALHSD